MARATAELERTEDAAPPQSPSSPESVGGEWSDLVAAVASYRRVAQPDAAWCRLLFGQPGTDINTASSIAVPLFVATDNPNAARVVAFLSKFASGEWTKGRVIAAELDMEPDGGQFRKIMGDLVRAETLESGSLGYRLRKK